MDAAEIEIAEQVEVSVQFQPCIVALRYLLYQIAHVAQRGIGMSQMHEIPSTVEYGRDHAAF